MDGAKSLAFWTTLRALSQNAPLSVIGFLHAASDFFKIGLRGALRGET